MMHEQRLRMTPAEQDLAVRYMPLARKLAWRYGRISYRADYEDLCGAAFEALCLAVLTLRSRIGEPVVPVLRGRIGGQMYRELSRAVTGKTRGFRHQRPPLKRFEPSDLDNAKVATHEETDLTLRQLQARSGITNSDLYDVLTYHERGGPAKNAKRLGTTQYAERLRQKRIMKRLQEAANAETKTEEKKERVDRRTTQATPPSAV